MIGKIFVMDESFQKDERLPPRFHAVGFWLVRILIAGFGGGLAVSYKVENPQLLPCRSGIRLADL
jgi:hypothetical protein